MISTCVWDLKVNLRTFTVQKRNFALRIFLSNCDQIRRKLERLSLIKTALFIPFFKYLFVLRILLASLLLDNLMTTFLLKVTNFSQTFSAVPSRSYFFRDSGNPLISRQSPLQYWVLLQHCLSKDTILSLSFELTFLVIARSDSIFKDLFLRYHCHFQYWPKSKKFIFSY